ncbi:hypothetical protein AGR1C_pTi0167 [Agrobacterium fabacearum TT111]|nr:hypothetical protein AGR1C_pTi0167 [Agrobacterium fabacearum TT111]
MLLKQLNIDLFLEVNMIATASIVY